MSCFCTILKRNIAPVDDKGHADKSPKPKHIYSDDELETIVGMVLNQMDVNGDGFVDYGEYRRSEVDQNRRADYPEGQP